MSTSSTGVNHQYVTTKPYQRVKIKCRLLFYSENLHSSSSAEHDYVDVYHKVINLRCFIIIFIITNGYNNAFCIVQQVCRGTLLLLCPFSILRMDLHQHILFIFPALCTYSHFIQVCCSVEACGMDYFTLCE